MHQRSSSRLGRVLGPVLALCSITSGAMAQRMPRPSKIEEWVSPHNLELLKLDEQAMPAHQPRTLPDGSEEPARAPWPFLLYLVDLETDLRQKVEERILADARIVLATRAVKLVRARPDQALELPFLAKVSGIQDPTLVLLDRDFEVCAVLNDGRELDERGLMKPLEELVEREYGMKLAAFVAPCFDLMEEEEKLWKDEQKLAELQEKAAKAKGARQAKYDAQADELEEKVARGREELGPQQDRILASLRLVSEEAEAAPTTFGSGRGARELTAEEQEAIAAYRQFARHENPIVRAAAVEDLGALDSGAMAHFVLEACSDLDARVVEAAGRALGRMSSEEAIDVILAAVEGGKNRPLRAALAGLASLEQGLPRCVPAVCRRLGHRDEDVRHAALRAVARHGDHTVGAEVAPLLEDRVPALRVMAAETLGKLKATDAVPGLCRALENSDWSLEKAAAQALGRIRSRDSIEPLLERFEAAEGLLIEVLYRALVDVTGQDYSLAPEFWRRWWDRYGDSFELPSDDEVQAARERVARTMAEYQKPGKRTYHTITTLSRKMIFVIDVSASMRDKISMPADVSEEEAARFPSRVKMDIARNELIELLGGLESNVSFNILTFAGEVEAWKPGLVGASSRTAAIKYVAELEAMSAPTTTRRRGAPAGGGDEQKTDTHAALLAAFGLSGDGATDWKARTEADTIFFVTDGVPTTGEIVDVPELIRTVTEINRTRGVVLHLVVFDQHTAERIGDLAWRNGGRCVIRGFVR